MKGLLLKDWYMFRKYCGYYVLLAIIFLLVSLVNMGNLFFAFYPCVICGMIPVTLLGYDERSGFIEYSATMPYTKREIVSSKYLMGLFAQIAVLLLTGIAQAVKMKLQGNFSADDYIVLMLMMLAISTFTSSISLPFMFKYGVEKGRIAYYFMIGFVCSISVFASYLLKGDMQTQIRPNALLIVLSVIGVGVYILSWYLSIVFYSKREIA